MLYDGLNVKDALAGKSKCRNKAIAEAFQYMKIIEGWGTGLPRLFRQCREMGLPEPKFEEFGDGIKVTIYRANGANGANEANVEANEANREANEAENRAIQDQILRLIKENPKISQTRIAEEIGVSRSTIQRAFGKLIESGQVQRTGGTRGSWIIQEKH
jgi:predicted HTH transcriptional regulator